MTAINARTTLVSRVTIHQPGDSEEWNDVPLRVEVGSDHRTDLYFTTRDMGITVKLTEGERIALIEALGGRKDWLE